MFASGRASANPGEIYALATGSAPRNVSRSPHADVALATSPKGSAYAFWSNRSGPWRLMIAPDGTALRSVAVGGRAGADYPPAPPVFSADGTQILIPYFALDSITQRPQYAIARVRSGPARRLPTPCGSTPALSPDGASIACAGLSGKTVSVADLRGHVRFEAPGKAALWSADGRLAVAGEQRTVVLSSTGRRIAALSGVARAWSRDGTTLALVRPDALALARPGAGAPRVVYRGRARPYWVAFAPDGRTVVFAGGLGAPQMVAVAGGPVRAFAGQPFGAWSQTGRYAFTVASGATIRVQIGDALARNAKVVARLPYDEKGVSGIGWLGDGRLLYNGSTRSRPELWAMRADGGAQRRLGGSAVAAPAWNRDGSRLAYASGDATGGSRIVIADAAGRKLAVVASRSRRGCERRQPELVAGRQAHRGRASRSREAISCRSARQSTRATISAGWCKARSSRPRIRSAPSAPSPSGQGSSALRRQLPPPRRAEPPALRAARHDRALSARWRRGIAARSTAEVTSAHPLSDEQVAALKAALKDEARQGRDACRRASIRRFSAGSSSRSARA